MSTLIIGGAFAVAILAIVGIVLLARSESNASARAKEAEREHDNRLTEPTVSLRQTRKLAPMPDEDEEKTEPASTMAPPSLAASVPAASAASDDTMFNGDTMREIAPRLNGQFHELVAELRTLHMQAEEIQRRLGVLYDIVEHVERTQSEHVPFDEE